VQEAGAEHVSVWLGRVDKGHCTPAVPVEPSLPEQYVVRVRLL